MALDLAGLKTAILAAVRASYEVAGNPALTAEQLANLTTLSDALGTAIDTFVKTGTVTTVVHKDPGGDSELQTSAGVPTGAPLADKTLTGTIA